MVEELKVDPEIQEEVVKKEKESLESGLASEIIEEEVKKEEEVTAQSAQASEKKKFFFSKRVCKFCTKQLDENAINYKNVDLLKKFTMPSGKILPRRISGNCSKHQKLVAKHIKRARILALLPFVDR